MGKRKGAKPTIARRKLMRAANVTSRPDDLSRIEQDTLRLTRRARGAEEAAAPGSRRRRLKCAAFTFLRRCDQLVDVVARQDPRLRSNAGGFLTLDDEGVWSHAHGETRLFEERRIGRDRGKCMPSCQGAEPDDCATQPVRRSEQNPGWLCPKQAMDSMCRSEGLRVGKRTTRFRLKEEDTFWILLRVSLQIVM